MDWFFIGVDLGQSEDYTAISVIERKESQGEFDHVYRAHEKVSTLRLRYLRRIPLGMPYPDMVREIVDLTRDPLMARRCHLAVDATGVGRCVVDEIRRQDPQAVLMPVTFTSGQKETMDQGFYGVPKRDLVVGLQVVLQRGALQIARNLPLAPKLVEEMMAMQVRLSPAGNEQYAAWRQGTHDDMVFAVALAYWSARKVYPEPVRGTREWWIDQRRDDAAALFRRWKLEEERKASWN